MQPKEERDAARLLNDLRRGADTGGHDPAGDRGTEVMVELLHHVPTAGAVRVIERADRQPEQRRYRGLGGAPLCRYSRARRRAVRPHGVHGRPRRLPRRAPERPAFVRGACSGLRRQPRPEWRHEGVRRSGGDGAAARRGGDGFPAALGRSPAPRTPGTATRRSSKRVCSAPGSLSPCRPARGSAGAGLPGAVRRPGRDRPARSARRGRPPSRS
jgi:hypothetical protein